MSREGVQRSLVGPIHARGRIVEVLILVVGSGTAWITFGHLLAPFDMMVFFKAGRQVVHGVTPYAPVTAPTFLNGHAFVYPYVVAWLFVPFAVLPTHLATIVYSALSVAAIVGSCQLLGRRGIRASALVLVCPTTIIGLQMGTLNALLMAGLAIAWRYRSRWWVCGPVVGMLAVAKLFLAPVGIWLLLSRRFRAAATAGMTGAALLTLGWFVGPLDARHYMRLLSALQADETTRSWSVTALFRNLGLGSTAAFAGVLAVAGLVIVCGIAYRWRWAREDVMFASAVVASLLISPIVWSSYLLLLAVPLLAVGASDVALIAFTLASWLLVTPDAASPTRVAIGAIVAVSVVVVIAASRIREEPSPRLGREGMVLAIAGLGLLLIELAVPIPDSARAPLAVAVGSLAVVATALCSASAQAQVVPDVQ